VGIWDTIKYEFSKGDSAVRQIIMVNIGAFLVASLLKIVAWLGGASPGALLEYFYLPSNLATLIIRPWTIVTNVFFHAGFWHILWNMVLLYFLGRILEDFLDSRKIWKIFLYGGLLGGLLFVVSYNIFPIFGDQVQQAKLLGASGGVTAIIVATGVHLPYYQIRPFGLFNVQLRWVALFFVFRDLYTMPFNENAGGLFAHLGGALFGLLYILSLQGKISWPNFGSFAKPKMQVFNGNPDERTYKKTTVRSFDANKPNQEEIDAILDKISQSGYDSLSDHEKEVLFKASE
jgi:membrane associated rhomboid family serine protease